MTIVANPTTEAYGNVFQAPGQRRMRRYAVAAHTRSCLPRFAGVGRQPI